MNKVLLPIFLLVLLFSSLELIAQKDAKVFMFGHSLMDHRPPLIETPSDETTIAHWLQLLSDAASHNFSATGQYGSLQSHLNNLPPDSQWGYDIVNSPWDGENQTFSEADFNTILMTALNYVQWQGPEELYYDSVDETPISVTQDLIDWLTTQEPGLKLYIYENWPDMGGYIAGESFPPTDSEMDNYQAYTKGDFHDWWIELHDAVNASHSDAEIKMIPTGPILSDLLDNTVVSQIPYTELYEDNAPHGRATLYFLASLVVYMSIYEEPAPANYAIPSIVHETVRLNYEDIVDYIWDELALFNFNDGSSRVFFETALPMELSRFEVENNNDKTILQWSTLHENHGSHFEIEYGTDGIVFQRVGIVDAVGDSTEEQNYSFTHQPSNRLDHYYRLRLVDQDGSFTLSEVRHIQFDDIEEAVFAIFPNPNKGQFWVRQEGLRKIELYNMLGQLIYISEFGNDTNEVEVNLNQVNSGNYILKTQTSQLANYNQIVIY